MTITVTITNARYLAAVNAAYLATVPVQPEPPADPVPIPYASAADYAQQAMDRVCESWAETTGVDRIPIAEFVRRFPGAVMDAVNAARDTNPTVAAILAQLDAPSLTHVRLGAQTTLQGVGYLVAAGYMTQQQADTVLAW